MLSNKIKSNNYKMQQKSKRMAGKQSALTTAYKNDNKTKKKHI